VKTLPLILFALACGLLALVSSAPAQYPIHVTHPTYYTPPVTFTPTTHRQIINRVNLIEVAAINPAYTSAYSPTGYDSSSQSSLLAEIQQLKLLVQALALRQQAPPVAPPIVAVVTTPSGPVVVPLPPPAPVPVVTTAAAQLQLQQEVAAQLLAQQQALAARLLVQQTPAQPPPPPALSGAALGLFALQTHCSMCHTAGKLAPGVPYALLDAAGKLATLTDTQKKNVLKRSYKKTMPPPINTFNATPVTDLEYAGLVEALD